MIRIINFKTNQEMAKLEEKIVLLVKLVFPFSMKEFKFKVLI